MKHEVGIMALFTPKVNLLSPNFKDQLDPSCSGECLLDKRSCVRSVLFIGWLLLLVSALWLPNCVSHSVVGCACTHMLEDPHVMEGLVQGIGASLQAWPSTS